MAATQHWLQKKLLAKLGASIDVRQIHNHKYNLENLMSNSINEDLNMNVTISNLQATEDEIKKLEELLIKEFRTISTHPKINLEGTNTKGNLYKATFTVTDTRYFDLKSVQELLYSLVLVGWSLDGTFVQVKN